MSDKNPWNIEKESTITIKETLQKFADFLEQATDKLVGTPLSHRYEDDRGVVRDYYSLQIILKKTQIPYKFIEVEPVLIGKSIEYNVRVFYYTKTIHKDNIGSLEDVYKEIYDVIASPETSLLINHLIQMDEMKMED